MQKQNDFVLKRKKTLRLGYLFVLVASITFLFFLVKIVFLQNTNKDEIEASYIQKNYRNAIQKAARGNLFATDGSILATTVMRYDIFIDFKIIKDSTYQNNISKLCDSMTQMFGKPRNFYRKLFDDQRKKGNQYYSLVKGLDFDEYSRLKNFPIFKYGKQKGGFIVDRNYKREIATSEIGVGTIGVDDHRGKSGLEGAFSKFLRGTDGLRLEQRVNSKQWKPIDYWKSRDPIDGKDVYTTLDLRIQDIALSALEKQLKKYAAEHGSVVVMETNTGKVRAMVNLRRAKPGVYVDTYNYILKDGIEPGSTFKTVSLLAAMEDGFIDDKSTVYVNENRVWTYAGQEITDEHSGGVYDISDVLAHSSNIGTAKIIVKHYGKKPQIFFDHLKRWKMFEKLDIEIPGITKPFIYTPNHKKWNPATLASISYGYSTSFNLLHLTTFYNGIANKGNMLKPLFIEKIVANGNTIYQAKPEVLVPRMATPEAIQMMTNALTKAVEKGTAKSIFTPNLKMAGKTGTTRFEYWKPGKRKFRSSFVGFYPSDNPKFTCYVLISEPDPDIGYYGSEVAAPVFKEIAGKTFLKTPQNIEQNLLVDKKVDLSKLTQSNPKIVFGNTMPNVVGLIGKNAIPQIENAGYRVNYKGAGKIIEQFPAPGTPIKKSQKIYLKLQF